MSERDRLRTLIAEQGGKIRKIVFSKPRNPEILRVTATPITLSGVRAFQLETLQSDNKAVHRNLSLDEAPDRLADLALSDFSQTNLLFTAGEVQVKVSAKGKITLSGRVDPDAADAAPRSHNREKNYLLDAAKHPDFLHALGFATKRATFSTKNARNIGRSTAFWSFWTTSTTVCRLKGR